MSEANGEKKQPSAKALRMAEVFTRKTLPPGKSSLLAKMKAFEKPASSEPEPTTKSKLPAKLRTSSSKKLWDGDESDSTQTLSVSPPSPSKNKVGFQMPKKSEQAEPSQSKNTQNNQERSAPMISSSSASSANMDQNLEPPSPTISISSSVDNNIHEKLIEESNHKDELSDVSEQVNSGQSDAMEAIEMARQAMGTASSASLMDNSASNQQLPPPNILRKSNSGNQKTSVAPIVEIDEDNSMPPPPPQAPGTQVTNGTPTLSSNGSTGEVLKSPSMTRKPSLSGLSRFKKAGNTIKAVASAFATNDSGGDKQQSSSAAPSDIRNRTSASPNRAGGSFRPSLKAGQQAIQEIERKQWLAKKQQQESAQRMLDIKMAQEKACLKTGDMNIAMAKLNSILSPNYQSPDMIHEMEMKADGVLQRIKEQLQQAALGGSFDTEEIGANYEDHEDDSHQKNAVRGKELILRLANNSPTKVRRDDSDDSDDDDDEDNDDDEAKKTNDGIFGTEGVMKWGGPITVDRLTDDAEEMANSRGLSGQKASYESLCSVLIVDGLGNVAANGWEEKFLSLSDSKLWSAAYFSIEGGTINTLGHAGRFTCVADLRSPGVSVVFEECSHTSTGFCIAVRTLSAFTIKLAPKRYKVLLEWGAALSQAINELPSLVEIPTAAGHPELSAHGGMYHARPSVAFGVTQPQNQDYNYFTNFSNVKNLNSGPSSVAGSEVSPTDKNWVDSYRRQKAMRRSGGVMA